MKENEICEIDKREIDVVRPKMNAEQALEQFKEFQRIKDKVLSDDDKKPIQGKPYINKSGWRKIKMIFNLTQEILSSKRDADNDEVRWTYRVRVSTQNGVYTDAEMSCSSNEEFAWNNREHTQKKPESAIMGMAQTRAFNRAISDLIGGGEVSLEEMTEESPRTVNVQPKQSEEKGKYVCVECETALTDKVAKFSMEKFGKPLCFADQKRLQKKQESKDEEVQQDFDGVKTN